MKNGLEDLYKNWIHGKHITLRFTDKEWDCEVERVAGRCIIGKGWKEFLAEAKVEVGDSVNMYRLYDDIYHLNVCIFKHEDYVDYLAPGICRILLMFYLY